MATNTGPSPQIHHATIGPAAAGAGPGGSGLPPLRAVDVASLRRDDRPVLRIKTDDDVDAWKRTRGYHDYGLFLRRLADAVVGHALPHAAPEPDKVCRACSSTFAFAFDAMRCLLTAAAAAALDRPSARWYACSACLTGGSTRSRRSRPHSGSATWRSARGGSVWRR